MRSFLATALPFTTLAGTFSNCKSLGPCYHVCHSSSAQECLDVPTVDFSNGNVVSFLTDNAGQKMTMASYNFSSTQPSSISHWQYIELDTSTLYQSIVGFGGAFTDSAAINLNLLSSTAKPMALESYFSSSGGSRYSIGRVPIAASDFSTRSYSYDNVAGDTELKNFKLTEDDTGPTGKIDAITRAMKLSSNLRLFASAWSAPPWMKVNTSDKDGYEWGALSDDPKIRTAWANYLSRFVDEYKLRGVPIWGMTMQNEPFELPPLLRQTWDTMFYTAEQALDFVSNYLGPIMHEKHPEVNLMVNDDQSTHLTATLETVLASPLATQYVAGVGVHWYLSPGNNGGNIANARSWLDSNGLGEMFILPTEACSGFSAVLTPPSTGPNLGNWNRGQSYGEDIMNDLNAGAAGWTDWNLFLDMKGGPNHAGNVVDAPILIDGSQPDILYKQPMYYYMAHFSAYISPGSRRIHTDSKGPVPLECTAFLTPDKQVVLVVMNRDYASGREWYFHDPNKGYVSANIPAASIMTFVYSI